MSARILIAGVGNVFWGDDGFGVEVARRLLREALPEGVEVTDYGIRGLHLAYRLLDPVDLLILVDALSRGEAPGTLYLMAPDLEALPEVAEPDAHGMDPRTVFASVRTLGGTLPKVRIVGCEPEDLGERMGLSPLIESRVADAVKRILELVEEELSSTALGRQEVGNG